jgi:hypothetical protein
MSSDAIAGYASKLDPQRKQICDRLQKSINAALPDATPKLWHAIPVWLVGENVVVGYQARKQGVMLMFWNGRHFGEPELQNSGSFHMAQIAYLDASEIDQAKLARWLRKAGTSIWDMVGERNAFVAKRRAKVARARARASKPKVAKKAAKAKAKAKARK